MLLTPDMQNRRIVDRLIRETGEEPAPTLESNSVVLLIEHVKTGGWATILPEQLARTYGVREPLRAIPVTTPEELHQIGLVAPIRDPVIPQVAALIAEAKRLAQNPQSPAS